MWRQRKKWEGPGHPWKRDRLEEEKELKKIYGLKNKKEIWKAYTIIRKIRSYVRYLNAKQAAGFDVSEESEVFLRKLIKLGLLNENSNLTDALELTVRDVLERRLQTIVWRKGLAKTIKQARQLITHRHIAIGEKVISSPGYLVKKDEEDLVQYSPNSPLINPDHPLKKIIEGNVTQESSKKEEEHKEEDVKIENKEISTTS